MEPEVLRRLIKERKSSQEKVAKEAGISISTVSRYLTGGGIAPRNLKKLEEWERFEPHAAGPTVETDDEYAAVPLLEVKASAGNGATVAREEVTKWFHFRREWLSTVGPVRQLKLLQVDGDSMEPTFRSGDLILVNMGNTDVKGGKIYACAFEPGELLVKRLHPGPGGKILVMSDNKTYPQSEVPASEFTVYGEVVWMARKLG